MTNPLFLIKSGGSTSDSLNLDAVLAQRAAPSQEMWNAFQAAFAEQSRTIELMGTQLSTSRRREELGAEQDSAPASPRAVAERNFAPTTAAPAAMPAAFQSKAKSLRQLGKQ